MKLRICSAGLTIAILLMSSCGSDRSVDGGVVDASAESGADAGCRPLGDSCMTIGGFEPSLCCSKSCGGGVCK